MIAKYGAHYVRNQLPRIIYSHVAKYIARYMVEATFVQLFGYIVTAVSGYAVEQVIQNIMVSWGIPSHIAGPSAWVLVAVAKWYI